MHSTDTTERLASLRRLMQEHNLQAYIVPSEDAHQSEYVADCDMRRGFMSGFTGSAGIAAITMTKAALWTDGRYFLQASQQIDKNWTLMRDGMPDVPRLEAWVIGEVGANGRIGIDPWLCSVRRYRVIAAALMEHGNAAAAGTEKLTSSNQALTINAAAGKPELVFVPATPSTANLVDQVWGTSRPDRPNKKIIAHDVKYAGESVECKIKKVAAATLAANSEAAGVLLTALDDIAWLFNLRGEDIQFNPVFFAYAFVPVHISEKSKCILYLQDPETLDPNVRSTLPSIVTLAPYSAIANDLQQQISLAKLAAAEVNIASTNATVAKTPLPSTTERKKLLVDVRCNVALVQCAGNEPTNVVVVQVGPVVTLKSIKNETQVQGFRECHLRDGAAVVEFFAWLEDQLVNKKADVDEAEASVKLEQFRAKRELFMGPSFDTISSTGANGAIIHYKPVPGDCAKIDPRKLYLCDSGGQYLDGTTDITRTLRFIEPKPEEVANGDEEKRSYTRVLQCHAALARIRFPENTGGHLLDSFAREPLWRDGKDFRHGTGHGVGHFLNVHEGPHAIANRSTVIPHALVPGMTVTDEPGYYEEGKYGIRIESILIVRESKGPVAPGATRFFDFENVTFVPFDRTLIDKDMLDPVEISWINNYHKECRAKIGPLVASNPLAIAWLNKHTQSL